MERKINVAAFGSCRLLTPLAMLSRDAEEQSVEIANARDTWYTHYLQEHIQKIEILTGKKTVENNDLFQFVIDEDVKKHYPDNVYEVYSKQTYPDFFKDLKAGLASVMK